MKKWSEVVSLSVALILVLTFSFRNIWYVNGYGEMKDIVDTALEAEVLDNILANLENCYSIW